MNNIETISMPKFSKEKFYSFLIFYKTQWPAPAISLLNFSDSTSATERISSQIKDKLKNLQGIESVWFEDRGKQINVFIVTKDVRNSTLHPIFDAQYELESMYKHLSFNFEVNSLNLEEKQKYNSVRLLF